MSELRDRLSVVIDRALSAWMTVDDALDGTDECSEQDFVAQAIIAEFGLTVETVSEKAIGHMVRHAQSRVVGKWERNDLERN